MSSVVISGDTSGAITVAAPAVAGTNTLTLPAQTATIATLTTPSFASTIGVGGATASASGAGITFPATQSASSDANTLDDYEEGTWTPTDGSGAGLSLTVNSAVYTKIGRLVTVSLYVSYPSTASGANAVINGLPFASSISQVYSASVLSTNALLVPLARINQGESRITLYAISTTGNLTNANFSSSYVIFTITYPTA